MKVTYWIAENLADSPRYNIRCKTRREVVARRLEWGGADADDIYGPAQKTVLEYRDSFHLLEALLGEGQGMELATQGDLT